MLSDKKHINLLEMYI